MRLIRPRAWEGHNLFGVVPGRDRLLPPLLLGAHYDSVISRRVPTTMPQRLPSRSRYRRGNCSGIFSSRSSMRKSLRGSYPTLWGVSVSTKTKWTRAAFIAPSCLDLVGHDVEVGVPGLATSRTERLKGLLFITGAESHPSLTNLVRAAPRIPELPLVAISNHYVDDMSDHGVFRRNDVPICSFLVDGGSTTTSQATHRTGSTTRRWSMSRLCFCKANC